MKQIATILGKLLDIASNTGRWLKVLIFVIVCGGVFTIGAVYFSKTKTTKCEDCSPSKAQVQQLIDALIQVRTGVKELAAATNYIMDEETISFMYASYDTIPKKKKPTQVQVKAGLMISKLDSIILKHQKQSKQ